MAAPRKRPAIFHCHHATYGQYHSRRTEKCPLAASSCLCIT